MQSTSALYQTIIAGDHWFETRLVIDGVGTYGETDLFAMSTTHEMFHNSPTIGSAVAGEITVKMVYPQDVTIPTMAKLLPQVRARNATQHSEWISQGVYYIDTRERAVTEYGESVLELHGYDAMLKAEQMYNGRITGDSTDIQMVNEIAYQMGVSVDSRTTALMTAAYTIPLPTGYSYREVLGYIASMYVGCFIITDEGKLRLVSITELPPETNYLIENNGDPIVFGHDESPVQKTVSGSIVSFADGDGLAVDDLTIEIEPVQSGTGTPSPNNIRPISGWSEAKVWVETTHDTSATAKATIDLGGTRYGGTLDVLTGVLTVDRVLDAITKDSAWYAFSTGTGNSSAVVQISEHQNCKFVTGSASRNGSISSTGKEAQNYWVNARQNEVPNDGDMCFAYSAAGQLRVHRTDVSTITDLTSFKANFPDTQVCYYLATPQTIQLTAQQISTLLGNNTIWADTGDVSVTYNTPECIAARILV